VLLLDTFAWVAWTGAPARLTPRALRAIAEEEPRRGLIVSAISLWEVAEKVEKGKLVLDRDVRQWVTFASAYPGVTVVPIEPADALESALLPGDPIKDPADRMIIALARRLECPIVTSDRAMRANRHIKTIW
jgi:PIN domain nuclease of toxin-antitoxin system